METFVLFINDAEFAKRQLVAFIEGRSSERWVLVGCPPRLPRHSGRFLSQPALKRWRADWTREATEEMVALLSSRGHEVSTRVAHSPLLAFTRQLRGELGVGARLIDARRPRAGAALEPITQEQPGEQGDAWSATGGAIALGALITIASE
ncbi:MAG: hypothetical protein FJY25_18685 [Betaproteobacteria bacterium]|nr:hypothetical protein [Betaproteobacteria bacterium]